MSSPKRLCDFTDTSRIEADVDKFMVTVDDESFQTRQNGYRRSINYMMLNKKSTFLFIPDCYIMGNRCR